MESPDSNELNTLDELIDLLKSSFSQSLDVDRVQDELKNLRQTDGESIDSYGARVKGILKRGTEAANEESNVVESRGVKNLLNRAAILGFKRGLRDYNVRTLMIREKPDSLGAAIHAATGIETEFEFQIQTSSSKTVVSNTKVYAVNVDDRRCYGCNQPGHLRRNCPHRFNISQPSVTAASGNSQNLNSQGGPQTSAVRKQPLIARVETIEPSINPTR